MNRNKTRLFILTPLVISIISILYMVLESKYNHTLWVNEPFHSTIEVIGSTAAIYLSIVFLNDSGKWGFNSRGLVIGFFMMGILDIFHSVMPPGQGFVFFHVTARLAGGIGFIIFVVSNALNIKFRVKNKTIFTIMVSAIIILGGIGLFNPEIIPLVNSNGHFTAYAELLDIFGGICFLVGGLYFLKLLRDNENSINGLFFVISVLFGISNLTFQFSSLWSHSWWVWHFVALLGYLFIMGFVLYRIEENRKIIEARNREINDINRKLNNYSYTISHDLKEPVRSIRTFSEFIMEDCETDFDETTKDYFNRIIRASGRIADMIDDLLILSRVGRTDIKFEKVPVGSLIDDVMDELKTLCDETSARVEYDDMPEVVCQQLWIQMVFSNLIRNSIKYRKDEIPPEIKITHLYSSGYHAFAITDNGKGIESEQHEKIFGLFRKAHTDKNKEGSGAGLAIVSSIIEQHKGRIWVETSAINRGTTFMFTIKEMEKSK